MKKWFGGTKPEQEESNNRVTSGFEGVQCPTKHKRKSASDWFNISHLYMMCTTQPCIFQCVDKKNDRVSRYALDSFEHIWSNISNCSRIQKTHNNA